MTIQLPLPVVPMALGPVVLVGREARLEPLEERHAAGMLAAATPETFSWLFIGVEPWTVEGFEVYVRKLLSDPNRVALAVIEQATGRVVGSSSYLGIRPKDQAAEIGTTWISPGCRGTRVNPEIKFLMLRHAFEVLKAQRIFLRVDARNARSLAAVRKLGAVEEGVMRRDSINRHGVCRDMVVFGIIPEDWARIRGGLIERLGYEP